MIVSHKHKFIFLKTNKTAGTSIEIALSRICGPDDIITPLNKEDKSDLTILGPQNHLAPFWSYKPRDIARFLIRKTPKKNFFNHMSAKSAKKILGDDIWNSYYKFCFEKNCVSIFFSM